MVIGPYVDVILLKRILKDFIFYSKISILKKFAIFPFILTEREIISGVIITPLPYATKNFIVVMHYIRGNFCKFTFICIFDCYFLRLLHYV